MALPEEYRAAIRRAAFFPTLQKDVMSHRRRIDELRDEIRLAESEIELHEVLLELAFNRRLVEAVAELHDSEGYTSDLARDPLRFCQEQNISLPAGVTLHSSDASSQTPYARVRRGAWDMEVVWDRDGGFFVRPHVSH